MTTKLNRKMLLQRLEPIRHEKKEERLLDRFERISLGSALLQLAELTHEKELELCREAALHLVGRVPEPDDADLD